MTSIISSPFPLTKSMELSDHRSGSPALPQARDIKANMESALQAAAAARQALQATSSSTTCSRAVYSTPTPFSSHLLSASSPQPLVYVDSSRSAVAAFYALGPHIAGHPGMLHGGASAALVDEIMGRAAVESLPSRKVAVTVTLELTYMAPVLLDNEDGWGVVVVCGEVQNVTGRVANVLGWMEDVKTGKRLVEAHGLFVEPKKLEHDVKSSKR